MQPIFKEAVPETIAFKADVLIAGSERDSVEQQREQAHAGIPSGGYNPRNMLGI